MSQNEPRGGGMHVSRRALDTGCNYDKVGESGEWLCRSAHQRLSPWQPPSDLPPDVSVNVSDVSSQASMDVDGEDDMLLDRVVPSARTAASYQLLVARHAR